MRVAGCFLLLAVSGLIWTSFGVFLVPLQNELGAGRGEISAAFSIFALANAVSAPAVGHAMRRWDSRCVLAALAILFGCAIIASAFIESVLGYCLVFGVIGGVGAQSVSSFAVFAILARRVRRRPASAMSVADAGSGLATLLGLPLVQAIIDAFGWRAAYLSLGIIILVSTVALHLLLLDPVARPPKRHNSPASSQSRPTGAVLFLAGSFFFGSAAYHGLMTQQIALLHDQGVTASTAVWFAAAGGGSVFAWRLLSGYLVDRLGPTQVMAIAGAAIVLTFGALILALAEPRSVTLLAYPLFMGIGFGGQQVILAIALRNIVRVADFAVQLSYCRLASGLGMAAGPFAAGLVSDGTNTPFVTAGFLAALSGAHCILYICTTVRSSNFT